MSISSEIQRIKTNIASAYTKLNEKGATMPSTQNSNNLTSTIDSINEGTSSSSEANWWNTRTKNNTDWTGLFYQTSDNTVDSTLDSSMVTTLYSCFSFSKITNVPNFDLSNVTNAYKAFYNSNISQLPNLNLSKVTDMEGFAGSCYYLTNVGNLDTSLCKQFKNAFNFCDDLTTIQGINLSSAVSTEASSSYNSPLYNIFYYDSKLQNITFYGSINASLDLSSSTVLTHDTLMSAINALGQTSITKTLTLGQSNLDKLTDDEKAIATSKGWTLS